MQTLIVKYVWGVFVSLLLVQGIARADDTAPKENVDDLLTNNNLRAYSGSTSIWSVASQFNYNGGTINTPLSQDRPNIAAESATTNKADLDGAISAKYNINTKNSVMAGVGIRWIAPLAGKSLVNYDGTRFDVMNPYIQYQYIYNWLGIQSVLQVQALHWTQADYTAYGYANQVYVDQENMFDLGKSGVSIGASVWAQYQWFNKHGSYGDASNPDTYVADLATQQSVWEFNFSPILEYQITEKINFRNVLNIFNIEHYASFTHSLSSVRDTVTDSVGIGFSITRDIFLLPNVQFVPKHISTRNTNVGLQATVNLF